MTTSANQIPGLGVVGCTYDVLKGVYADSRSCKQQVVDWRKGASHEVHLGGKTYSVPDAINFQPRTASEFSSTHGRTATEYLKTLAIRAGLDADVDFFRGSLSLDFGIEQKNPNYALTRILYIVSLYNLSAPPASSLKELLRESFVKDLDSADPFTLYGEYGTHLVHSAVIGGSGAFTAATDTRKYHSEISIEVAAKLFLKYKTSGGEMSAKEKEAIQSFLEASVQRIRTVGGDPKFVNDKFFEHIQEWAQSVLDYPAFIDFGQAPSLIPLYELASGAERRKELQDAYDAYIKENSGGVL